MTRPTSVVLLGQRIGLSWEPHEPGPLNEPERSGRTDVGRQQMHVREGMGFHQERDTVLHEVVHAALGLLGRGDSDEVEAAVGALSPVLLELLRRDRALVEWLTEPEPGP